MKIEIIDINLLRPYKNNPRKNLNVDKVADSIKEFGFQQPIVIDLDHNILAGHTRFEASKKLDLKQVPVIKADLDSNKAKAYRLADNRVAQDSNWDLPKLNIEIEDLKKEDYDIDVLGFEEYEIEKLFNAVEPTFEATNTNTWDYNNDAINAPTSAVRMVQLFLDAESEPLFKKFVEHLKDKHNTANLTDTGYKVVENAYNNS